MHIWLKNHRHLLHITLNHMCIPDIAKHPGIFVRPQTPTIQLKPCSPFSKSTGGPTAGKKLDIW